MKLQIFLRPIAAGLIARSGEIVSSDTTNKGNRGDLIEKGDAFLQWYDQQPWLRAIVQAIPGVGGSIDTLLAWRGSNTNQKRIEELLKDISERLSGVEDASLPKSFLGSDEFFELFRTIAEVVARSASEKKRRTAADFLAGIIMRSTITDLSQQMAEDLRMLQELHLQILAALPDEPGSSINRDKPPPRISDMDVGIYRKGLADLERLGLIFFNNKGIGLYGGGGGRWETTQYLTKFKEALKS